MQFVERGNMSGKTLMLLPGTACDWQTNFFNVMGELSKKYHLICVNYDGFDGAEHIFSDMETITDKIEEYIIDNYNSSLDGVIGSSLGGSFVGLLVKRNKVHFKHVFVGSSDFDQNNGIFAKLQTSIVIMFIKLLRKNHKIRAMFIEKLIEAYNMDSNTAEKLLNCFLSYKIESIRNEYYSDLTTDLGKDIKADNTIVHCIYAKKMGEKYKNRYNIIFKTPDIRTFDMQHEQWLFEKGNWTEKVLHYIDETIT